MYLISNPCSLCLTETRAASSTPVVACYYTSWAQYRQGIGKFEVAQIDPHLCTDIIFAFAQIDQNTNQLKTFEYNDVSKF